MWNLPFSKVLGKQIVSPQQMRKKIYDPSFMFMVNTKKR
ncbi:unnamed protein product [Spirodela intermedia]|uniref:Uncharacterized protein n=1 Tax=Spirodela intermedia TaxID=51605 RepID=A0A7I8KV70_SPIIN|nr:unnamed protein product [Spirodela intermedia]